MKTSTFNLLIFMGNPVAAIGRKKEYPVEWSRKNATFMENSVFIIMFAS